MNRQPSHAARARTFRERIKREESRASAQTQIQELRHTVELKDAQILYERHQRAQAQRGLVVYVRALESLNAWLLEHPDPTLEAALKERGLHAIRLGYDPDVDPEIVAMGSA